MNHLKQVLLLLALLLLTGCKNTSDSEPEFYITSNGKELIVITELKSLDGTI